MHALALFSEETPAGSNVTWMLWVALGFFALMVVVGWLASRNKKQEEEPTHEHLEEDHGDHH